MTRNNSIHAEGGEEQILKVVTKISKDDGLHCEDNTIKEKEKHSNTMLLQYEKELKFTKFEKELKFKKDQLDSIRLEETYLWNEGKDHEEAEMPKPFDYF